MKLTSCSNLSKLFVIFLVLKIDNTLSDLEKLDEDCKSKDNSEDGQVNAKTLLKLFSPLSYETGVLIIHLLF